MPWDKTVINNVFGEAKLALKCLFKAPTRMPALAHAIFTSFFGGEVQTKMSWRSLLTS